MRHIPAVKRLLVVHKAWKFGLLNFLSVQHQHSVGERHTHGILYTPQIEGPLGWLCLSRCGDNQLTASGPQKTARACRLCPGLPPSAAATDLHGGYGMGVWNDLWKGYLQVSTTYGINESVHWSSISQTSARWTLHNCRIVSPRAIDWVSE